MKQQMLQQEKQKHVVKSNSGQERQEPQRQEPQRQEPQRQEPQRQEPQRQEPQRQEHKPVPEEEAKSVDDIPKYTSNIQQNNTHYQQTTGEPIINDPSIPVYVSKKNNYSPITVVQKPAAKPSVYERHKTDDDADYVPIRGGVSKQSSIKSLINDELTNDDLNSDFNDTDSDSN